MTDSRYRYRLLAIVLSCTLFAVMNGSMVNVALPTLMRGFGIGIATTVWLYTGHSLPVALAHPLLGLIGERFGAKTVFLAGVAGFLVGSILCSAAWNFPSLLAFRAVQALAAAAVVPNALVLIAGAFPPNQRGQALGLWSAVSGIGVGIGPALGGVLTQYASWRAIFWVNVPFLLVAIVVGSRQIRPVEGRAREHGFDFVGAGILAAGLGALMLALTAGQTQGWTSPPVLVEFAIAAVGLVAFPAWEARTPGALLPLSLVRTRAYSLATGTVFLQSMVMFAMLLLLPLYLQSARGHSPTEAGVMILPMSLAMALFAPIGGTLSDRLGPRLPTTVGMVASGVAVLLLTTLSLGSAYLWLGLILFLAGAGFGMSVSPLTSTALNAAQPDQRGAASGFFSTTRFVGAVIGSTVLGVVLSSRTDAALPHIHAAASPLRHALALLAGFHDVYLVGAAIAGTAIVAALFLRPAQPSRDDESDTQRRASA